MRKISKLLIVLVLTSLSTEVLTAQSDSIKIKAGRIISNRFPSTRTVNIEYEYVAPLNSTTKTHDGALIEKGRLANQNRVKLDVNIPFLRLQKWVFTGSLRYRYNYFDIDRVSDASTEFSSADHDHSQEGNTYAVSLNSTYVSRVFDKPLIFNMSLNSDFSQDGFERITGMALASVVLKRSEKMAFTVGVFALIDPMIHYPVLPLIGLEYKLPHAWSISIAAPQYAYLRKTFSKNNRLSIGTNITSDTYYLRLGDPEHSYRYNKAEIKTGLVYEHYVSEKFILTARGGMVNALKGTLNRRSESYNKYIIKTNQDAGLFFNLGVSYNLY